MFRSFFLIFVALVSFYLIAEKFVNTNGVANEKTFSDFLKWSFSNESPERVAIEISDAWKALDLEKGSYILWIGHASFLINLDGTTILTDPIFSKRASPVGIFGPKRLIPPALNISNLPKIDLITISHNHYDHLDINSLVKISKKNPDAQFLVPKGDKKILTKRGIENVSEFLWWENSIVKNLKMTFTPVQHWSARGLGDRNKSLWGGWFFESSGLNLFHAGDTGYSNDFLMTREKLGAPEYALIPIGAYSPEWFMAENHVNPKDALQIAIDLDAKKSIGMHWGTFILTDEAVTEPPQLLQSALEERDLPKDYFVTLKPGDFELIHN